MSTHENVSQRDALDIVFVNRNRAYGAYQLRREYPATLSRALGLALLFIALLLLMPRILAAFSSMLKEEEEMPEYIVFETKEINIEVPPPVLQPMLPPAQAAIAYTPPLVTPDDQAPDTAPTDIETLLDDPRNIGTKNVEGPTDVPPNLDPPGTGIGMVETPQPADDDPVEPFAVNKMPSFPGGESEMFKWIYKQIVYPEMAIEAGTQGPVVLTFVVGKDGGITDIQVVRTPAGGAILGKEAVRVVKSMPKWSPGEANGHAVKVRFTLPIRFALK